MALERVWRAESVSYNHLSTSVNRFLVASLASSTGEMKYVTAYIRTVSSSRYCVSWWWWTPVVTVYQNRYMSWYPSCFCMPGVRGFTACILFLAASVCVTDCVYPSLHAFESSLNVSESLHVSELSLRVSEPSRSHVSWCIRVSAAITAHACLRLHITATCATWSRVLLLRRSEFG
jgi:hypothetical protein